MSYEVAGYTAIGKNIICQCYKIYEFTSMTGSHHIWAQFDNQHKIIEQVAWNKSSFILKIKKDKQ